MNRTGLSRVLAPGVAALSLFAAVPAYAAQVTISVPCAGTWSFNGDQQNPALVCSTSTPPPPPPAGAPTGCSPAIATSPPTLTSAGGTATLSVPGCTASGTITYQWKKNGQNASTSESWQDTLPANSSTSTPATTSYTVNVCNDGSACTGSLPAAPLTATVPAAAAPPPTGEFTCEGFSTARYYKWDWPTAPSYFSYDTSAKGPVGTNGILVVEFTTTPPADTNVLAVLGAVGYPGGAQNNVLSMAISTTPCDLSGASVLAISTSSSPRLTYGVGTVTTTIPWTTTPSGLALNVGQKYYLNIAGRTSSGQNSCQTPISQYGHCEFRVEFRKPTGH